MIGLRDAILTRVPVKCSAKMVEVWSPQIPFARTCVLGACLRSAVGVLAGTVLLWLIGLAGLLALADLVHVDIPIELARKLPLLQSQPQLIFAGESRTEFGVDPFLAADILGKRPGYAVNIAYEAGEPLAVLGAARAFPDAFRDAHVVLSVAPFVFNEGVRSAAVYPIDVVARQSVAQRLADFLPLRIGTLIRYIRTSFAARLADVQGVAIHGSVPPQGGVMALTGRAPDYPMLGRHPHYQNWDVSGPRARGAVEAMCELVRLTRKLTVVEPPWIPGDRSTDVAWLSHEAETLQLLRHAAERCGFAVLDMHMVDGLTVADYSDEMHMNKDGMPLYTRSLLSRLAP